MKKTLGIAAAAVLAAAPFSAVFAAVDDTNWVKEHTDTLNVNVGLVCTLGTIDADGKPVKVDATTHTNGDGSVNPAGVWAGDVLAGTMMPGTANTNFGSSTLSVKCNDSAGYTITAEGASTVSGHKTDLYAADADAGAGAAIASTASEPTATASNWAFQVSTSVKKKDGVSSPAVSGWQAVPSTAATIVSQDKASSLTGDGDQYTISYGVSVDSDQEEGSYVGKVNYVLAKVTPDA